MTEVRKPNFSGTMMQTFTNGEFYGLPEELHLNKYSIEDIAEALSKKVRWGGHCDGFISVAQHSVHVSELCPSKYKLEGLLHDMTEAFLGDVPRPIKKALPMIREYEDKLYTSMAAYFGVLDPLPEEVHLADNIMLVTEAQQLMRNPDWIYETPYKPLDKRLELWSNQEAKNRFIHEFYALKETRNAA